MADLVIGLYCNLAAQHGARKVSLVGDSSGDGLVVSIAMKLRDDGDAQPSSMVLFSPWLDLTVSDPGQVDLEKQDPMLAIPGLKVAARAYAGKLPVDDPRVSPLFGNFEGLAPILLLTGTHDVLNSDARRARQAARQGGADLTFSEYKKMIHVWPALPIPEAKPAFDEAANFLKKRWGL